MARSSIDATGSTGQVRAFGQILAMTEWLSPEELQSYQTPLLAKLLLHARKTTSFYKERLDEAPNSPEDVKKNWLSIPIMTRAEAVTNRIALLSRRTPRDSGPVIAGQTSGSTGIPFSFKKSGASVLAATALLERMFRWWSIDGTKSYAHIAPDTKKEAPAPDGRTTRGWHSNHPRGIKHFIAVEAGVDAHLQWLSTRRPSYLGTYAPVLKELAVATQKRGIDLKFSQLMSFGTVLDEETRELCRCVFGAEIADTYGAQEVDHIAAQCRACGEYHISAEATLVEVLRSDGTVAAPGEIGRVVVTPLYNYAMPLIRYELGDMAEVGSASSACRRGLPTLRRILGRTRNMFRFRDGTTLWPVSGAFRLGRFIALKQFQIVQTDLDHVEIRYVPEATDRPVDLSALTQRIHRVLRHPVDVVVRSVDRIERSSSGKYEECISHVPMDWKVSRPMSPRSG
jgi:phenylacetate-CoA ligase